MLKEEFETSPLTQRYAGDENKGGLSDKRGIREKRAAAVLRVKIEGAGNGGKRVCRRKVPESSGGAQI